MKSFKNILAEVAQPRGEDEIDFKAKHEIELIDEPNSEEEQHSGGTEKCKPRKADYVDGEDEAVYESDNQKYSWALINQALMATGHTPPQILKVLSALNKLTKTNEAEELDEISKNLVGNYYDKAMKDRHDAEASGDHKRAAKRLAGQESAYDRYRNKLRLKPATNKPVKESVEDLSEVVHKLDKVHHVHVYDNHPETAAFAKAYTKGHKGDHRSGGPTADDEKHSEKFHTDHDRETIRSGFAGSGITHYTNKKTGHKFEVSRTPNGKGFHGTDHIVRKLKTDAHESFDIESVDFLEAAADTNTPLTEEIKGWKHASRDISNARKSKAAASHTAVLHSLKKDGNESGMHDARKSFPSEKEAREHHANIRRLNPIRNIRHNLYVNGKLHSVLAEEALTESAFSVGNITFADGSKGLIGASTARMLNDMHAKLSGESATKMVAHAKSSLENYNDLVKFAKETQGKK